MGAVRLARWILLWAAASAAVAAPPARAQHAVEGIASVAWGDPERGSSGGPLRLTVRDDAGFDHAFTLPHGSPAAGFDPGRAQGRRVRVVSATTAPLRAPRRSR